MYWLLLVHMVVALWGTVFPCFESHQFGSVHLPLVGVVEGEELSI
jgi:hypothetical protein